MLKLGGCLILVLVGTAIGIRASERLRTRYKKLVAHYIFIGEISDLMRMGAPLEEIFRNEKTEGLIDAKGYEITVDGEGLNRNDLKLLDEFFSQLGMSDLEAGISRCATYRELIYKRVNDAQEEMKQKSRLYSLLGMFSGIITAILFL